MQRFRHPSNLRNDPQFRAIEKKLDEAGYARAVKLFEIVAEVGGKGEEFSAEFTLRDNTDISWLADEWRISSKKAQATLEVFAGVGLIDAQAWSEQIVRIPLLNDCLDEYTQRQKKARNSRATTERLQSDSGVSPVTAPAKPGVLRSKPRRKMARTPFLRSPTWEYRPRGHRLASLRVERFSLRKSGKPLGTPAGSLSISPR